MAQTQRKPVYIQPEHHEILRRIAFEQRCNLSDVLDSVLEQANWEDIAKQASSKPIHRAAERGGTYKMKQMDSFGSSTDV
jgi:fatty acid desaturase